MISKIYSELNFIHWVGYRHHTYLPEMPSRSQSIHALSAVSTVALLPELIQTEDDDSKRCNDGQAAYDAQKRSEADKGLPGKITKPEFCLLPEQLFVHRLWRVMNGPRGGTWLCEQCEEPHEECLCPNELVDHHVFEQYFTRRVVDDSECDGNDETFVRADTEEWAFVAWREDHQPEMFIDRRQFGRHAADPEVRNSKVWKEADEEREKMLNEYEEKLRSLEIRKES